MTPEYRIEADGRDISRLINNRFVSLSVTDEVADQADKLSLNLADPENSLSVPPTGGTLRLWLGYQGRDLHYRGSFVVDETSISGPGTNIAITARAADMRGNIKAPRDQTWHESSLAEIAKTIATRHNLKLVLGPGLEQITYPHQDQTSESDLNFIYRLGAEHGIAIKIANQQLRLARRAEAVTVGSEELPAIQLPRQAITTWQHKIQERQKYNSVTANWQDHGAAETRQVKVGDTQPTLHLRRMFPNENAANAAAAAALQRSSRDQHSITLNTVGRGDLYAGAPLRLSGIHPGIDGEWIAKRVVHSLSSSGYTCGVEAEPVTAT